MSFQTPSLKRKLVGIIFLTSILALCLTCVLLFYYEIHNYRQTVARSLSTTADIISANSAAVLIFDDQKLAGQILSGLQTDPEIIAAALYDKSGKLYATYPANLPASYFPSSPELDGIKIETDQLSLFRPVIQEQSRVGTLYLKENLNLSRHLKVYGVVLLIILGGSGLVALFLSNFFQQQITAPLLDLAEVAKKISEDKDFSVRATKTSDDELGLLTDSFNNMLTRIQASDSALRASDAQFRLVTDQAPVLLAQVDLDYRYKFVNGPYAARYGFKPAELIGKHAREIVGDALFEKARPYVDRALAGEPVQYELDTSVNSVERRWSHAEYTPEKNAAGEVIGLVAVHTDITARKRHEAELAKLMQQTDAQARLFDATLSSIADLAYTFDLEGNWIYANKPLLQLWGKSLKEISGKSSIELGYPLELAERLKGQVKEVVKTGKPFMGETYYTDAAGNEDYHEYIFSPVLGADGSVTAVCGTTRLTTERKRAALELERARDQALAASRAKDDFLAALSHELRTPLNPVLLVASDAATNTELPAGIRNDFEMIRRNVELEARLIDDLLDLTRITRGKLSLDKQNLDVHQVLQEAIGTVRAEAEAKQIIIALDLNAGQNVVAGDSVRLQQVFWNVLKNAVKFTPPAGKITVKTFAQADALIIKVIDTGIGINADELERVFTAFAQGDHAEGGSHRFGGLGLGLAISQRLVELHSGIIHASSGGRDQGATFTIQLPLCIDPKQEGKDEEPILSEDAQPAAQGVRILLVEDHEPTRTALAHLLTRRNFEVLTAATATEAREIAAKTKIDLLISDIGLPDGNGYDLMGEMQKTYNLNGIALTGYGMEEDISHSKKAGFVAHLTKPVRIQSLEKALAVALKHQKDGPLI